VKHATEELGGKHVNIIWIPLSGIITEIQFERDILEILDIVQKAKEYGRDNNVTVELCLAKTWLPLGLAWHDEALVIHRLNTAMETAGYYWLRCRVIDLTVITMHRVELKKEKHVLHIEGLEDMFLVADHYQRPGKGGMAITYQAGRKAREILRRVLVKFELEPDWDKVTKSTTTHVRIEPPRAFIQGRSRVLPAPVKKVLNTHEILPTRSAIRMSYLRGRIPCDDLPPTGLDEYEWDLILAQSTIPGRKKDELSPVILSPGNRVLLTRVRDELGFTEPTRRMQASPGGKRKREEKTAESSNILPDLSITIPNRRTPTTRARSAHSRLEPRTGNPSRRLGRSHDRFTTSRNARKRSTSKPQVKRTKSDNRADGRIPETGKNRTRSLSTSPRRRPALRRIETTWVTASESEDEVVEIVEKETNRSVEDLEHDDAVSLPAGSPEQSTPSEDSSSSDEDDGQSLLEAMLAKMVENVKEDFRRQLKEKKARRKARKAEKKQKKKE